MFGFRDGVSRVLVEIRAWFGVIFARLGAGSSRVLHPVL